jgi:Fe-S-cluster containining protein
MSIGTPALDPKNYANTAAPGRDCGTCTLCCKVYDVPDLQKPAGKWCQHCTPGRGCGIHETRPGHCRSFFCLWMTEGWLGPEWKPEVAKFVLSIDPLSRYMMVQADPGQPKAWRAEPYMSQFRRWAQALLAEERLIIALNGKSATVITHQDDVELGFMGPDDRVQLKLRITPNGPVYDIMKNNMPAA